MDANTGGYPAEVHGIAVYREGERAERGEVTLEEAAERLAVSPATVRRLIVEGVLPASQICKGAPWTIRASDLRRAEVADEAARRRKRSRSVRRLKTSQRYP